MPITGVEPILPADLTDDMLDMYAPERGRSYSVSSRYYLAVASALGSTPIPLKITDAAGRTSLVLGRLRREAQHARIGYLHIPLSSLQTFTVIYQGILGACDSHELINSLERWLRTKYGVQQIAFTKLEAESELAQALIGRKRTTALPAEPHWRLRLPDSFEQLLARHSGKHRQRLRWERRKLEDSVDGTLVHAVLNTFDDVECILAICESLGESTYHAKVGGMVRRNDVWRTSLGTLAKSESLACHLYRAGDVPIAFVLAAHHEGVTHILAMAYLPEHARYSPGKHLLLEVLRDSCARGMEWVDYGFGDAQYKQVYGSHCSREQTLLLSARTLRAEMIRRAIRATTSVHIGLQHALGSHIAERIKRQWRQRLGSSSRPLRK